MLFNKKIEKCKPLDKYKIDIDSMQQRKDNSLYKIGETELYTLFKYIYNKNSYFLRQEKSNHKNVVYLGTYNFYAYNVYCLFDQYIVMAKKGLVETNSRLAETTFLNINTGIRKNIMLCSQFGNMVFANGYGRSYCQDQLKNMYVKDDTLIMEYERVESKDKTDKVIPYNEEMKYIITIQNDGERLAIHRSYEDKPPKKKNTSIKQNNQNETEEDVSNLSSSVMDLYGVATPLGDILISNMKKIDKDLEDGITTIHYDLFMRLAMYLIRLEIFDSSKYNGNQIKILNKVWEIMATNFHSFFLTNNLNVKKLYNKPIKDVEVLYLEKVQLCDYLFASSDEQSLLRYLEMPATFFGFDYMSKDFLDIDSINVKMEKEEYKNKYNSQITTCILNGYAEYAKDLKELKKVVNKILKDLDE